MSVRNSLQRCHGLLATLFSILILTAWSPNPVHAYELLVGAEGEGTFSYFAVKTACRTIRQQHQEIDCRPVPTTRPADSLTNLQNGSLDLAVVDSKTIADAFLGTGAFRYIALDYDQLRLLMPLYQTPMSLLVRRNAQIGSLADLPGKRVNIGIQGGTTNKLFREIMAAEDWQDDTFRLLQTHPPEKSQDMIALMDGSVQALFHVGMHPDESIKHTLASGRIDLIGIGGEAIDRMIDANKGFGKSLIPSGTYPGQTVPIETIALDSLLITSADIDPELVTLVMESLLQAKARLQNAHPALLGERIDSARLNTSYLHPHPAAILYVQANPMRY